MLWTNKKVIQNFKKSREFILKIFIKGNKYHVYKIFMSYQPFLSIKTS